MPVGYSGSVLVAAVVPSSLSSLLIVGSRLFLLLKNLSHPPSWLDCVGWKSSFLILGNFGALTILNFFSKVGRRPITYTSSTSKKLTKQSSIGRPVCPRLYC